MTITVTPGGEETTSSVLASTSEPTTQAVEFAQRVRELEEANSNLYRALEHSRDIGVAMGVLMSSLKVTREEAFDLLREASMRTNRRLYLLALDVVETGALPR